MVRRQALQQIVCYLNPPPKRLSTVPPYCTSVGSVLVFKYYKNNQTK